jgi:hypothetical protein
MRGRMLTAAGLLLAMGLARCRVLPESPARRDDFQQREARVVSDIVLNPSVDLDQYNTRHVGWVAGQLCGVEMPGLAPTRREFQQRLPGR